MDLVFFEFETHELEDIFVKYNKSIKVRCEKKLTSHARIADVVCKMTLKHNEEVTGYASLKKRKAVEDIAG